jgi:xylulokinase
MPCHYHGLADTYLAHTFTTGGMVEKWFRDKFWVNESVSGNSEVDDIYQSMSREAEKIPPGSEGLVVLPHLQGAMAPENNPKAKGVFYGITLKHEKAHFVRAIKESVAYIIKRNIDVLEQMGIPVKEIRSLGGGAKSDLWNQIKADVTERPVVILENDEAACLGAAIVAGVGTGIFDSYESAVEKMVREKKRYIPNSEASEKYKSAYAKYIELYESLVSVFES